MERMRLAIFLAVVGCCSSYAVEHIHSMDNLQGSRMKVENGVILAWRVGSQNAEANQIDLFDRHGNPLLRLNVLRLVPEAKSVVIDDVSISPGRMIAVAAVYVSKKSGLRPAATLLYFDAKGQLLFSFALAPSREITRLAIDDDLNVWTLTHGAGKEAGASTGPMVVEYDATGKVVRELLRRDKFPFHAQFMREGSAIGSVESGYDSRIFWFWLPGSTEIVTVQTSDTTTAVTKTSLPQAGSAVPLRIVRESSGSLVAETRIANQPAPSYFEWSPSTKLWSQFDPGCKDYPLIGLDAGEQIYLLPLSNGSLVCTFAGQ